MKKNLCRSGLRGMTLVETIVGLGVSCAVLMTLFTVSVTLSKQTDRDTTRIPINSTGRAAMDDMLYYLRGTQSIDTTSTATKIIVTAPSYDPAAPGVTTGGTDTITFDVVGTQPDMTLYETITPSGGTVRKAIPRHVIAKNVKDAAFSYYSQQTFPLASYSSSAASSQTFTLNNAWKTGTTPSVSLVVNGTSYPVPSPTQSLSVDATMRTVTVGNVPSGSGAAEIRYELELNPGSSTLSPALSSTTQVNIRLQFLKKDSRLVDQVFTITGSAHLRNMPSS